MLSPLSKHLVSALLATLGFVGLVMLEKPFREALISSGIYEVRAGLISGSIVRIILLAGTLFLIRRFQLVPFTGLRKPWKFKNLQALILAAFFIVIGISGNTSIYTAAPKIDLILFILFVLLVGMLEEFLMRGFVLPQLMRTFRHHNRVLYISVLLSGLLFGIIHFANLLGQPENLGGIISQVFFALAIGTYFGGLMLRTENILLPGLIHALVNFAFGPGRLVQETAEEVTENTATFDASNTWPTAIFFGFILFGGLFMVRMADKQKMMGKVLQPNNDY